MIGIRGKNAYYDFTDMGMSDFLARYLNPQLAAILKKADNNQEVPK